MKKISLLIVAILIILLSISSPFEKGAGVCHAGSYTDYLNLYKPSYSESGSSWWSKVNDNFALMDKYLNFWADVRAYGAKGDGITDDTAAIQNAINAVKGTSVPVFFPPGIYIISQPLTVTDRTSLIGVTHHNTNWATQTSLIKASASFSGTKLIDLTGPTYCIAPSIKNLGFVSGQNSGIAAIAATAQVLGATFKDLYFFSHYGLMLNQPAYSCVIDYIQSEGYVDTALYLTGNHNVIKYVYVGGHTGTTAGPYIMIENAEQLILESVLVEGSYQGKSPIKVKNSHSIKISNIYFETAVASGYILELENSKFISVNGGLQHMGAINGKIKLTKSSLFVENLNTDGDGSRVTQCIEADVDSYIEIQNLFVRDRTFYSIEDSPRIKIHNIIERFALDDRYKQAGWKAYIKPKQFSGENLLMNPSFEQGNYSWTVLPSPPTIEEYIASEVSHGLMAHYNWTTPGAATFVYQTVAIPSQWVGRPFTFTGKVKLRGSAGRLHAYADGCGITLDYGLSVPTEYADPRWSIVNIVLIPQSAGNLKVGVKGVGLASDSHIYVDDFALSPGAEGMPDSGKFQSIELGGNSITYGSAAPTTGTWKVGDKVYNTAPAAGGYIGWVCIVAGTPGTWKGFGTIAL